MPPQTRTAGVLKAPPRRPDVLKDPARLRRGLDEMLSREKELVHRGPGDDAGVWLTKLAELDAQEERLLDLYLEGKLEADRYERRAAQIRESRRTVQDELARVEGAAARLERLEGDGDALLERYSRLVPERLDALEPGERNRVYRMLDLSVLARKDGGLELSWTLGADPCGDNEPPPPGSCRTRGR